MENIGKSKKYNYSEYVYVYVYYGFSIINQPAIGVLQVLPF